MVWQVKVGEWQQDSSILDSTSRGLAKSIAIKISNHRNFSYWLTPSTLDQPASTEVWEKNKRFSEKRFSSFIDFLEWRKNITVNHSKAAVRDWSVLSERICTCGTQIAKSLNSWRNNEDCQQNNSGASWRSKDRWAIELETTITLAPKAVNSQDRGCGKWIKAPRGANIRSNKEHNTWRSVP